MALGMYGVRMKSLAEHPEVPGRGSSAFCPIPRSAFRIFLHVLYGEFDGRRRKRALVKIIGD